MKSDGKRIFGRLIVLLALACLGGKGRGIAQQNIPAELVVYPEMVVYNGKVLTADDKFTVAEALAVRDGKFLAVGTTDRILKLGGPKTRKVDLQGKSVTPGFIETHYHTWVGNIASNASRNTALTMPGYHAPMFIFYTKEKGLESLKKITDQSPPGKWLWLSSIRNEPALTVTAQELDTASPNNPVTIVISPQDAVVNSKALALMFQQMPSIKDMAGLLKDESGQPTGQLRGNAFGTLMYDFFPWGDLGPLIAWQKRQLQTNVSNGVTTRIGRAQGLSVTILNELHKRGELPLRVRVQHEFLRMLPDPERFFKRMGNMVGMGDDWLKIIGTTALQVGSSFASGGTLTIAPKRRVLPGSMFDEYGANQWTEKAGYDAGRTPREDVILAGKYGWNIVGLHTYGDKEAEMQLEAFEQAVKEWPQELTKHPYVLDHNFMHNEDTLARAQRIGVLISSLLWFRQPTSEFNVGSGEGEKAAFTAGGKNFTDPLIYMYGVDRLSGYSRVKSLIARGIKPMAETLGTPLQNLQYFVDRKDEQGKVWGPNEAVDRKTALWMKTRWAGYYTEEENKLGSIEPGKLADFVVLGKDYMTVPEGEIGQIPVLMTVVGGKVQFEAPDQK